MDAIKESKSKAKPAKTLEPGTKLALMLLAALTAGFLGGWLGGNGRSGLDSERSVNESRQIISSESQLISEIAKEVGPSVVSVNVISQAIQRDSFFGFAQPIERESAGTGFIISENGYVVTNRHVIPNGATSVTVTLSDGTELSDVEVVGRTSSSDPLDIAFLRIKDKKGKDLKPAKIGDSSRIQVGDRVVAIGNALGQFQNTVTSGIISGFGREVEASDDNGLNVETLQNLIQTDASINQGNSGGPLVNMAGEVIAVNTAVAGGLAENIGFAIPANDLQGIIKSVLEKGKLERPYLGIRYITLTDDYAFQYSLPVKRGAYVAPSTRSRSILQGSPAEKAGLKEKDIVTKIDGTAIDEKNSLTSLIGRKSVGDEVTLTVNRDGKDQEIKVKLDAAPQN